MRLRSAHILGLREYKRLLFRPNLPHTLSSLDQNSKDHEIEEEKAITNLVNAQLFGMIRLRGT